MIIKNILFIVDSDKPCSFKSTGKLLISVAVWFLVACEPEYTIAPFYEGIYKGRSESITGFIEQKTDTFSVFRDALIVGELDKTAGDLAGKGQRVTKRGSHIGSVLNREIGDQAGRENDGIGKHRSVCQPEINRSHDIGNRGNRVSGETSDIQVDGARAQGIRVRHDHRG